MGKQLGVVSSSMMGEGGCTWWEIRWMLDILAAAER